MAYTISMGGYSPYTVTKSIASTVMISGSSDITGTTRDYGYDLQVYLDTSPNVTILFSISEINKNVPPSIQLTLPGSVPVGAALIRFRNWKEIRYGPVGDYDYNIQEEYSTNSLSINIIEPAAPSVPPENLRLEGIPQSGVSHKVLWGAVSGASTYELQRCFYSGGAWSTWKDQASSSSTTYTAGTTSILYGWEQIRYRVRAVGQGGLNPSGYSSTLTLTVITRRTIEDATYNLLMRVGTPSDEANKDGNTLFSLLRYIASKT